MLNKCILMGRLTRDPILRHTQTNTPVTSFSIAIDRFGRGEQRQTDFIDIVCWEKLAEFTSQYFTKGLLVAVVGRLQQRQWKDKDGNSRNSFEVVASEAHFAERKQTPSTAAYTQPPSDVFDGPAKNASAPQAADATGFGELLDDTDDDDGDLPF